MTNHSSIEVFESCKGSYEHIAKHMGANNGFGGGRGGGVRCPRNRSNIILSLSSCNSFQESAKS